MHVLVIRNHVAVAGTAGRRITGWSTARPSGSRVLQAGVQQQATNQPGGVISGQQSSKRFKQGAGQASYASGKGAQQGARSLTPTRADFSSNGHQEALLWTSLPPWCCWCHRCLPRNDSLQRQGRPSQRGVPHKLTRLPGFGLKVVFVCPRSCSQAGVPSDCHLGLGI